MKYMFLGWLFADVSETPGPPQLTLTFLWTTLLKCYIVINFDPGTRQALSTN